MGRIGRGRVARVVLLVVALALLGLPAVAQAKPATDPPDLIAAERFPIGLWWPPPPVETTALRYEQIADAGFTLVHGGNGVTGPARSARMLEQADAAGLDALVVDPRLRALAQGDPTDEEIRAGVAAAVTDYREAPAFAGFNLFDEPNAARFSALAGLVRELERQAPQELSYVNLWPSDVPASDWGTRTYEEYLRRFAHEVRPPMLSFDVYPLLDPDDDAPGLRPQPLAEDAETLSREYFRNWEMVRDEAIRSNLPAWVFIQTIDYDLQAVLCPCRARRRPTEAEVRWQANMGLAYGAKGIQWFTYWTPASNAGTTFGSGVIGRDGVVTDLYSAAQRINPTVQRIGGELLRLRSERVEHTGAAPPGTRPFHPGAWVSGIEGDAVVLGRFRGEDAHRRWLLVVNRSPVTDATTELKFGRPVETVTRLDDAGSGRRTPAAGDGLTLELPAGGAALLRLDRLEARDSN